MNRTTDESLKSLYKEAFSRIQAPADVHGRVFSRIAPRSRAIGLRVLLAMCLVLALTGVAVAQVGGDWLGSLINLNGCQAPALTDINQTLENRDARWTLKSAASDGTRLYLLMDVDSLNGQSLSPDEYTALELSLLPAAEITRSGNHSQSMSVRRLDDGFDPQRATLVLTFDLTSALRHGEPITLTISSLERCSDGNPVLSLRTRTSETVAVGPWTFAFRLRHMTRSVAYPLNEHVANISPLGVTIEGATGKYPLDNAYLLLTDGSAVQLLGAGAASAEYTAIYFGSSTACSNTASFDRLIDPEEAAELVIDGIHYPLNGN